MTGAERITGAFTLARASGKSAALMPYLMAGFPTVETSVEIGRAYIRGGADLIEVGVPFSDPLADGPVIHAAGVAALDAGATVSDALDVAEQLSKEVPTVVMCYSNPIYAFGEKTFIEELERRGISGLIVPDMPLEESTELVELADARGIAFVPLVAPTTTEERMSAIGKGAKGFLYTVGVVGTTGERSAVKGSLDNVVARAKAATDVPVAVGFGIGTPESARDASNSGADGVIVGSRLVRAAAETADPAAELETLVGEFAAALVSPIG